jgi:hypothetical protein
MGFAIHAFTEPLKVCNGHAGRHQCSAKSNLHLRRLLRKRNFHPNDLGANIQIEREIIKNAKAAEAHKSRIVESRWEASE